MSSPVLGKPPCPRHRQEWVIQGAMVKASRGFRRTEDWGTRFSGHRWHRCTVLWQHCGPTPPTDLVGTLPLLAVHLPWSRLRWALVLGDGLPARWPSSHRRPRLGFSCWKKRTISLTLCSQPLHISIGTFFPRPRVHRRCYFQLPAQGNLV